jgi:hypothetical protein
MFDFLAHWFAKTEIVHNEKGQPIRQQVRSHFKNGHFSLDLTFICIVLVLIIVYFAFHKYKNYNQRKFKKMYELTTLRSQSDVERVPLGSRLQNCAVTQTGI